MLKSKFAVAISSMILAASVSIPSFASEPETNVEFEGRVIGLIACNSNQNVVVTLHNEQSDDIKSFITQSAPNGILNPVLAKAYVSVGKKDKPAVTITYDPNYVGENCGNESVVGYWNGYAK